MSFYDKIAVDNHTTNTMLDKIQTQSKRLFYRLHRDYLTVNNVVIACALLIAFSWTWSSIEVMQQNYELQQSVDAKRRQVELEKLRVDNLQLEGKFYTTLEYQELAVRERLGKGMPGEHALIVPSTVTSKDTTDDVAAAVVDESNLKQWAKFLFGGK